MRLWAVISGILFPVIVGSSICLDPGLQFLKNMIQAKPIESQGLAERWLHDPARDDQSKS